MSVRKRKWTTGSGEEREAWVAAYTDTGGTRRLKTFSKKKDADAFAASAHVEVRAGVHVADSATISISEAGEYWIADAEQRGLERATIANYRQHLRTHIVPLIGREKLSKLSVPLVRDFEARLLADGRSATLTKKVLVSLGSLLRDAQERGLTTRNPVGDMRRRRRGGESADKRRKPKLRVGVDIPSPEEIGMLIRTLEKPRFGKWKPLFLTAIFTGLRVSELRGLRWCDVDFDRRELHVRQRADRFGTIGRPKSAAGERVVPLPPGLVTTLREWRLACPRPRTSDGGREAVKKEQLAFPNGQGRDEPLNNILKRGLWPACVAAGLTVTNARGELEAKYSMHALRHWYASWSINPKSAGGLGLPPKVVQERLGHSTIAMTMDTYGHLFPRGDDAEELAAAEYALLAGNS